MLENPFTPESKKAKKSLFATDKKARFLNINKETLKLVKEVGEEFELGDYGGIEIKKYQLPFLHDLENLFIKYSKNQGQLYTREQARKFIAERLASDYQEYSGKAVHNGEILGLDLSADYDPFSGTNFDRFGQLPQSISILRHLEFLALNHGTLSELPTSIANLPNLIELQIANCKNLAVANLLPLIKRCKKLKRIILPITDDHEILIQAWQKELPNLEVI